MVVELPNECDVGYHVYSGSRKLPAIIGFCYGSNRLSRL